MYNEIDNMNELVSIVFRLNNISKYSSNYCYKKKTSIENDLKTMIEDESICVSYEQDEITGMIFWFENKNHKVCDVNLFVIENREDYIQIMSSLLNAMKQKVNETYKFNFFFPNGNSRVANFLDQVNASKNMNEYILKL